MAPVTPSDTALLQTVGLHKRFGGLEAVRSVDFRLASGEIRAIIGPNGAGKTTLFNLITGELRPDRGSVTLFDRDITRVPSRRRFHLGIARTYQIITLFPGETLLRNVTLSLLGLSRRRWNPFVRLDRQAALIARARETLARVGLDHLADRPLAQTPRVLLLDEPFAGLDQRAKKWLEEHLASFKARGGAILMATHSFGRELAVADRIAILAGGAIALDTPRGALSADDVQRLYGLHTEDAP